jgi:hypothetical protein
MLATKGRLLALPLARHLPQFEGNLLPLPSADESGMVNGDGMPPVPAEPGDPPYRSLTRANLENV